MFKAYGLKRIMKERRISKEFLSEITGLNLSTLILFLRGKSITPDKINTICSVLKVQPDEIIEYVGENR